MKKILFILVVVAFGLRVSGQGRIHFNPERFEAEMGQFIVTQAGFTPQEASVFFALFKEMQGKQRLLFSKMRSYRHTDTDNDRASLEAIRKMDEIDIRIKKLQQEYHTKFCKVLPAGKVLRAIKAEDRFHRQTFRRFAKPK